jgi:hypothetical protein
MAAGADSIDDMDLLRHGAMPDLFAGIRAPCTLGSFLRAFTFGNVRQLEKVNRELLAGLARRTGLLPGADQLAFIDVDSMQRRVYGHKKQGAAFGHTKIQGKTVLVRGLNALAATICTPQAAPVIAAGLGVRRRGRRDSLHRVRLEERPGHHRPADRPPGPRPQPQGRPGTMRAVPGVALPPGLHRLAGAPRGAICSEWR